MDRAETLSAVPILAGFLGTLLQDAADSAREALAESDAYGYDSDKPAQTDDTIYTCPESTFNAAADICRRFLAAEGVSLYLDARLGAFWNFPANGGGDVVGSDLYLTIAGHGAGFWDGDWEPHGDALTEAARAASRDSAVASAGENNLLAFAIAASPAARLIETYVGDDGHVYIAGME